MNSQRGKIIILTAPSGAGKTSITRYLLQTFPKLSFSISATTRALRGDEQNGKDYYFLSEEAFHENIRKHAFVEWEMVYQGKYYGTLQSELERIWDGKKTPVLDIDVKGAIHVQQQYDQQSLTLFIQPPSVDELQRRLRQRGTETEESIQARVNKAAYEMSFKHHFNKIIINDDLSKACAEAEAAVVAFLGW